MEVGGAIVWGGVGDVEWRGVKEEDVVGDFGVLVKGEENATLKFESREL